MMKIKPWFSAHRTLRAREDANSKERSRRQYLKQLRDYLGFYHLLKDKVM